MKIFALFVIFMPFVAASVEHDSVNITQGSSGAQEEYQNETEDAATATFEDGNVQYVSPGKLFTREQGYFA